MERMIPKSPRSGKQVARNVGLLVFGAVLAFATASRSEPGPLLYIVTAAAFPLLAFALFEAAQWIWRTRR